ncbi:MAG: hypothetical protein RIQ89_64 [Bacteroidota bacterium]|jgi:poly(A) polymerase
MHLSLPSIITQVVAPQAVALNLKSFLVGGFVRDLILQRGSKDIDIVCLGSGINLAKAVAQALGSEAHLAVFKNFGTAMVKYKDFELEFVGARKESYRADSRKPIVEDGTLEEDLLRRDFTINAMAIPIALQNPTLADIIDPFNGAQDISKTLLRTPLNPDLTFSDDPLRMMRAIRFATQLHFKVDEKALHAIKQNAHRLKIVSQERITDELNKIILSPKPSIGFKLLFDYELLAHFFPQLTTLSGVEYVDGKGHKDNFYHTLEVLDNIAQLTNDLWLRWSAILHDIAKPATKKYEPGHGWTFHGHEDKGARMVKPIFNQLKLPLNEKMKLVQKLVQLHLRPIVLAQDIVTDSAVRRLLFDAGDDIESLMMLCKADVTTKNEFKKKKYRSNFEIVLQKIKEVEEKDRIRNWQPPISGEEIMARYDLPPGRLVGELKNAIREAILDGQIANDRDQAIALLQFTATKLGLRETTKK